jgi:hypothetical protein
MDMTSFRSIEGKTRKDRSRYEIFIKKTNPKFVNRNTREMTTMV